MQARTGFVVSLSLVALFLNGCSAARQPTDTPIVVTPRLVIAIRDAGILHLIDPMTGAGWLRLGEREASLGLATGSGDAIFASITAADGANTEVYAISLRDRTTERIGMLPGRAYAKRLSSDSARLYLLLYTGSGDASTLDRVLDLPIPDRWRGSAQNVPPPVGEGSALALDGAIWYRVVGTALERGERTTGDSSVISRLPLPAPDVFTSSLLMAPDGRTLYVIDYRYGESIYIVDAAQDAIVQIAAIRPQETTKQTTCAASLSPRGDRLYIAANNGVHENGIDVIDTTTMKRVANFLPERTFYCLAVSPDGEDVYATSGGAIFAAKKDAVLTTIDTHTGSEERTVPITIETVPALALATSIG